MKNFTIMLLLANCIFAVKTKQATFLMQDDEIDMTEVNCNDNSYIMTTEAFGEYYTDCYDPWSSCA